MTDDNIQVRIDSLGWHLKQLEDIICRLVESGCHCDASASEWGHTEVCKEIKRLVRVLQDD